MSITHTFVSAVPDGVDPSLIRPSDWNAAHTITAPVGIGTASAAASLEIVDTGPEILTLRATGGGIQQAFTNASNSSYTWALQSGAAPTFCLWNSQWASEQIEFRDTGETHVLGDFLADGAVLVATDSAGTQSQVTIVSAANYPLMLNNVAATGRSWWVGPSGSGSGNFTVFRSLDSAGVYLVYGDTAWTANSDARLKQDVTTLEDSLGVVTRLRPIAFRWKDRRASPEPQLGFLAQEVQTVAPLVVRAGEPVTVETAAGESVTVPDPLGVIETAKEEDCNFIILGRSPSPRLGSHLVRTFMDQVLQHAPCHVAVVKCEMPVRIERVTVAVEDDPNSRLALELLPAFAAQWNATRKILATVYDGAGEGKARELIAGLVPVPLSGDTEIGTVPGADAARGILAAAEEHDAIVMGEAPWSGLARLLAPATPDIVAEKSSHMVILVKAYQPPRKRSILLRLLTGA